MFAWLVVFLVAVSAWGEETVPRLAARGVWPGYLRGAPSALALSGTRLYVARSFPRVNGQWGRGVLVFEVSNPANPIWLDKWDSKDSPLERRILGLCAAGDQLFVADGTNGVHRLSAGLDANLQWQETFASAGEARDIQLSGEFVYVANGAAGVSIHQLAEPSTRLLGRLLTTQAERLQVRDQLIYLADGSAGIKIIDAHDVARPALLGSWRFNSWFDGGVGCAQGIQLYSNRAVVASGYTGMQIFDISKPAQIDRLAWFFQTGITADLRCIRGSVFEANPIQGTLFINAWNPYVPVQVRQMGAEPVGLEVAEPLIYIIDNRAGLEVYDPVSQFLPRRLGRVPINGFASHFTLNGHYGCVADGKAGLQILDIANPADPQIVADYVPGGFARQAACDNGTIYLAAGGSGVHILSASNLPAITLLGQIPGAAVAVQVKDGIAYILDSLKGLKIYSVAVAAEPRCLAQLPLAGTPENMALTGDRLYLACGQYGLMVLDVASPEHPRVLGVNTNSAYRVKVVGDRAYVAALDEGWRLTDVADPTLPKTLGYWKASGPVYDVCPSDSSVFLACGNQGIEAYSLADSQTPRIMSRFATKGSAQYLELVGNHLYAAAGQQGVLILNPWAPSPREQTASQP